MKITNIFYITLLVCGGLFACEYFTRKAQLAKPSTVLNYIVDKSQVFFTYVGQICAKISSFYTLIDLGELVETFQDLFMPMVKLVASPAYSVKGYLDIMHEYKNPIMIVAGSLTLLVAAFLIYIKFFQNSNHPIFEHQPHISPEKFNHPDPNNI